MLRKRWVTGGMASVVQCWNISTVFAHSLSSPFDLDAFDTLKPVLYSLRSVS